LQVEIARVQVLALAVQLWRDLLNFNGVRRRFGFTRRNFAQAAVAAAMTAVAEVFLAGIFGAINAQLR